MDAQGSVPPAERKAVGTGHESDSREAAIVSDDTMPAIIELLVLDEVEAAKSDKNRYSAEFNQASATQNACQPQSPTTSAQHTRQPSRDKVMTAAQFEMYRRALDMHHGDTGSDGGDSQDEYGDDDDDEKQKSAASKQRQQQEAYLRNRRFERSKTSHVTPKPDANMGMDFGSWEPQSKTPSPTLQPLTARSSPGIQTDDDDDDIPLAFLKNQMSRPGETAERRYPAVRKDHSHQHQHLQPFHFVEHSQTRLRPKSPNAQMRSPTPVLQPVPRAQSPMPQNYGVLHRKNSSMGINMSMSNASLLSLSQPSHQRPHTSGGLIAAIDHLQSPGPRNHHLNAPKDFLGIPVNPPKFYGRRT